MLLIILCTLLAMPLAAAGILCLLSGIGAPLGIFLLMACGALAGWPWKRMIRQNQFRNL